MDPEIFFVQFDDPRHHEEQVLAGGHKGPQGVYHLPVCLLGDADPGGNSHRGDAITVADQRIHESPQPTGSALYRETVYRYLSLAISAFEKSRANKSATQSPSLEPLTIGANRAVRPDDEVKELPTTGFIRKNSA